MQQIVSNGWIYYIFYYGVYKNTQRKYWRDIIKAVRAAETEKETVALAI